MSRHASRTPPWKVEIRRPGLLRNTLSWDGGGNRESISSAQGGVPDAWQGRIQAAGPNTERLQRQHDLSRVYDETQICRPLKVFLRMAMTAPGYSIPRSMPALHDLGSVKPELLINTLEVHVPGRGDTS